MGALLRCDIEENLARPATPVTVLAGLLLSRGVQVCVLVRLGAALHARGLGLVAAVLQRTAQLVYGVDIDPRARIGPGLVLRHPGGIVVGRDAVLGRRVRLFQGVTLGNRLAPGPDGMPLLGDDVHVFAGAAVLGPVTVGDRTRIGANAVLTRSCPADSVVAAPPAVVRPPS